MDMMEIIRPLLMPNESKIILLVMDGLGGIPVEGGKTELELAKHPHLDKLAQEGTTGVSDPIMPGVTPGSGPAHLGLFGYDPIHYNIGRGVLEALGMEMNLTPRDVAIRANFATMDKSGNITDRRAGRIATERNVQLCNKLRDDIKKIEDVEIIIEPGKEHRIAVLLRGDGLGEDVGETDPERTGVPAHVPKSLKAGSEKTARVLVEFMKKVNKILETETPANTLLMRGVSKFPKLPTMQEAFAVKAAAIANYPMYRGLAKLVGMEILKTGDTIASEFDTLEANWKNHDFFYVHIKKTDSYGEDGDYKHKIHIIEEVDTFIPRLVKLSPAVILVTGDHSTPAKLKGHSWHPSPVLLWAPQTCLADDITSFGERACMKGGLGHLRHLDLMPLMLAHALRMQKYGA
jgi:2,3-bisphosphoglycerate-independent phosphoglycerate mutase